MVMLVAGQTHVDHGADHLGADVDAAVDRSDREIAALGARTVAEIAALFGATCTFGAGAGGRGLKVSCRFAGAGAR